MVRSVQEMILACLRVSAAVCFRVWVEVDFRELVAVDFLEWVAVDFRELVAVDFREMVLGYQGLGNLDWAMDRNSRFVRWANFLESGN